jgi:hypothetical protein
VRGSLGQRRGRQRLQPRGDRRCQRAADGPTFLESWESPATMNRIWAGTKPHVVYGPYKYLWHAQRSRFSLPTASEAPVPHPRFIHSPRALAKTQWSAASKGFQKSMMLIRPPRFLSPSPAAAPGEPRLRRPPPPHRPHRRPHQPQAARAGSPGMSYSSSYSHRRCFVFFFLAGSDTGMARRSWRR